MADRFQGIVLDGTSVKSGRKGGSVRGAQATVSASGSVDKRVTATRLALTGPLAFGMRKGKDDRSLFISIYGPGWEITKKLRPTDEAKARKFAAKVNAAAAAMGAAQGGPASVANWLESPPASAPRDAPAPPLGASPVDQLRDLAKLRDDGVLTPEEFEAKKAELLKRI